MKELKRVQLIIKDYYELTKPGIIYGNILTLVAGFLYASKGNIDFVLFLATILGTTFVIAGSCVLNNVIDIRVDKRMKRTSNRALVKGTISENVVIWFGVILSLVGFITLIIFTNLYVVFAGILAVFSYLVLYSYYKRKSWIGTVVGTIPGAIPLTAGYLAVAGKVDLAAVLLFLIMVFWQLPHFYALGIFRMKDYKDAGLPILPVSKGIRITKIHIFIFITLFLATILVFSFLGFSGITFLIVMFALNLNWLLTANEGFKIEDEDKWSKKIFKQSLVILLVLSLLLSLEVVLP